MVDMEQLVPIGRFSKMTRLSIKALRLYDEIGLLAPAEVDPSSGYRYYRLAQAREAEAIRTLRSIAMPLDEISAVLRADDPELVTKVLDEHRARLAAEVDEARRRLAFIGRLIRREEPIMGYEVTTKQVEAQVIAGLRKHTSLEEVGAVIAEGFGRLFAAVTAGGMPPAGMPFIVFHDVIDEEAPGDVELCIPVSPEVVVADDDVEVRELDAAVVASVVHHGAYDEVGPAYHVLTGWMQEHGHEPVGPPREYYLNDPTQVPVDELLTEVQWPIG